MIPNIGMSYYTTSNSHGKHSIHNRGEIIYEVLKTLEKENKEKIVKNQYFT